VKSSLLLLTAEKKLYHAEFRYVLTITTYILLCKWEFFLGARWFCKTLKLIFTVPNNKYNGERGVKDGINE
jgi:hypothetical protein